jgi:PAS domain S-box-containing protein
MDFSQLDFEKAKARHILFKTRLRSILYGSDIDRTAVFSHVECSLGKWIYDQAIPRYSHIPEISELERVHRRIHECGRELVALYEAGHIAEAQRGFNKIEDIATDLLSLLSRAEVKIGVSQGVEMGSGVSDEITVNYREVLQLQALFADLDRRIGEETRKAADAQRQSEESESKFKNTMMQAPVGMAILRGPDMLVEMANAAYLEIVDKTAETFVGKPLLEVLPEVKESVGAILAEVFRSGVTYHGNEHEIKLRRAGRSQECFFNFVYQPLLGRDGQIDGIIVMATEVTSQVIAKREILQSEHQFRNLVTQSQFAKAILKGEDMVISIANEALLAGLWRRKMEDIEGKKLLDVFPELKDQKFSKILEQVYKTGMLYRENEALTFVNGPGGMKQHYIDFQYAPLFEIDGSVSAILVSINDVTEKVEAREQINDAVERLKLATEGTQLATWDLNLQTREIIYSERLNKIFGYADHVKLSHQSLRDHVHPDDVHSIVEPAFDKALETGIYYYEARVVQPDGQIHWVRTHGKVIFDDAKVPRRMLGTMMDITASKVAELALKTSEGKFRTLADSMPQLIWTSDTQGHLNYFSRSVYEFSGLEPEKIGMKKWLTIVHPDDRFEMITGWRQAIRSGEDFIFEHRFLRDDGEYRWHISRALPQKDIDGTIHMWVGTSTDIHDRKLFIDELESKVSQRTTELSELNKELQKTNMELAQFAYVASHDLQEPLRKIQTFATRLLETELQNLSERGKDYFNRMQASAVRIQQLIVDLLAFSRANAVEKHMEEVDINLMIDNIEEQLQEVIRQKEAVLIYDRLPVLNVIPFQFEQLLMNLISNGLKFTSPDKRPEITIKSGLIIGSMLQLEGVDLQKKYHFIAVADNGIGFDPQYKERIFQVFQRLHHKNKYEGTGIGLAICKKIVDNHQGFIDAVGMPEVGSTFTVYIPA